MDRAPQTGKSAGLAQAKAAFLLALRARGIRDVNVLRALETVPREIFVPHRYQDLARRHSRCRCVAARRCQNPFSRRE